MNASGVTSAAFAKDGQNRAKELFQSPVGTIGTALVVVILVGELWVGGSFLSTSNVSIIGAFVAVPIIVGTLSSFALLSGVVDLSIGSMVGFSATIFAALSSGGWSVWWAAFVSLALSALFGLINSIVIVTLGTDPIIATLGMLIVLRGLVTVFNGGTGAITSLVPGLFSFANAQLGVVPTIFVLSLFVVVLATVVTVKTRLGRHVRAVGGDEQAARRAGISVTRIRYGALIVSALGAGIGGLLYIGQLGGSSNLLGTGLEFQVYAALMIGGYSILRGGVGNPSGGLMGLLVVAGVGNMLDVQAINPYYHDAIVGVLLIAAVLLDRLRGGDSYE